MTSTNEITKLEGSAILKTDTKGRVRIPREKQEELLVEYDRSGMTGAEFAKWCGVKYTTLCGWLQRKRRESKGTPMSGTPVKWLEAVIGPGSGGMARAGVVIYCGTIRVEVSDAKTAVEMLRQLGVKPC